MSQQCLAVYLSETCLFINPVTTWDFSSYTMCAAFPQDAELSPFGYEW